MTDSVALAVWVVTMGALMAMVLAAEYADRPCSRWELTGEVIDVGYDIVVKIKECAEW